MEGEVGAVWRGREGAVYILGFCYVRNVLPCLVHLSPLVPVSMSEEDLSMYLSFIAAVLRDQTLHSHVRGGDESDDEDEVAPIVTGKLVCGPRLPV